MAHVYASYSGSRDQEDHRSRPARRKVHETPSQPLSWAWWHIPVIQAMQEAEVEGLVAGLQPRPGLH
jgi:hypothetical protein